MASPKFRSLLNTLGGAMGLFEKFVAGQDIITPSAIERRMRRAFGDSLSDQQFTQLSRQISRGARAGDLFNRDLESTSTFASRLPTTRGLRLPTDLEESGRARFVANVSITVERDVPGTRPTVTKSVTVTADRTLSPAQLRDAALDELESLFQERQYRPVLLESAQVDVKWAFLTR